MIQVPLDSILELEVLALLDSVLEFLAPLQKGDEGVDLCIHEGSSCIFITEEIVLFIGTRFSNLY
jgi:hypothetical protein